MNWRKWLRVDTPKADPQTLHRASWPENYAEIPTEALDVLNAELGNESARIRDARKAIAAEITGRLQRAQALHAVAGMTPEKRRAFAQEIQAQGIASEARVGTPGRD